MSLEHFTSDPQAKSFGCQHSSKLGATLSSPDFRDLSLTQIQGCVKAFLHRRRFSRLFQIRLYFNQSSCLHGPRNGV